MVSCHEHRRATSLSYVGLTETDAAIVGDENGAHHSGAQQDDEQELVEILGERARVNHDNTDSAQCCASKQANSSASRSRRSTASEPTCHDDAEDPVGIIDDHAVDGVEHDQEVDHDQRLPRETDRLEHVSAQRRENIAMRAIHAK